MGKQSQRPPDPRLNRPEPFEYGPKMAALDERRQAFVKAMAVLPFGSRADWVRMAGYSTHKIGAKVRGHRLVHDPKIEAAVFEYASALMHTEGPLLSVAVMMEIARDKEHPRQLQAAEAIADRIGLHRLSEHRVRVEHSEESAEAKVERIRMVASLLGVDVSQLLGANVGQPKDVTRETKVIEHKPEEGDGT
jgi:hypothetical protein